MSTKNVADRLVELCGRGDWKQAQDELFHQDAVSVEPAGNPFEIAKGMDAIRKKAEQWSHMIEEVHENKVSDPIVAENFFAVTMTTDSTMKEMGRIQFEQLCVYEVKEGKIVKEQFFYTMPEQPQ